MKTRQATKPVAAFSRLELLLGLGALALLLALAVPALASPRLRSQRVLCANNLRQIGAATQLWGNDHRDLPPYAVTPAEGGTRGHPLAVNPWLHFSWLSNELASPVVFLCPSDSGRPARDFTGDPTRGYVHPNFANRATSYFLGHMSSGLVTGDRNVGWDERASGCPLFTGPVFGVRRDLTSSFRWNTNLHNQAGNLLLSDGGVEQLSSAELYPRIAELFFVDDNSTSHFITPR